MKTKILFLLLLLALPPLFGSGAMAQSMTDDQVLSFITRETQNGASQSSIATQLISKGVTMTQLQRVKRKAERMKAEEQAAENAASRQEEVGIVEDSKPTDEDAAGQDLTEKMDDRNAKKVFGRNIFSSQNLTFAPSQNIATPANYVLGAGDDVTINIWGASQQTLQQTISPDGYIVVSGVGPIRLAGLSLNKAKETLRARLGAAYADCQFDLSVAGLRSMQVQVMGEVVRPGTYTLSSLSSAFNALYAAGGVNDIGSLRDIRVYRRGSQIASIDVYDYILHGNTTRDIRLADGDVIKVGPYDCLVKIIGHVKRPMWYEMKKSETVKDLLEYSGGFDGKAYTKGLRLKRTMGAEYSIYSIEEAQMGSFQLADGDLVEADENLVRYNNLVEVKGAVKHPGEYQLGDKIQSVKDLLLAADGLIESAYTKRAIMHREKEDKSREIMSIDAKGILDGTAVDIPLHNGDVLFIPDNLDMQGNLTVRVNGEINYPGDYPYAEHTTLREMVLLAGGLTQAGSLARVDVFRRVRDVNALADDERAAEHFALALNEDFSLANDTIFELKPFDIVYIRKSPAYEEQKNVSVTGQVNFPGIYTMTKKGYRLSDLIRDCGGVTDQGYMRGTSLLRIMTQKEREQRNVSNLRAQIDLYEEGLREGKELNLQLADSLLAMKTATGNTYSVAIDLEKAMKQPGCVYDLVLREGDVLNIPKPSNTVKISGEVMHPVSMAYEKGKSVKYYIKHAGGYANKAYKRHAYGIHMNGSVVRLSSRTAKEIEPGTEIVIPSKTGRKRMSTTEIMATSSSAASLASVIVALMNIVTK
ncbi:MAG: SLBB domain-containing protein [Bacteroidaceae bacterium]|nr:SLBB domain-containing protein [Bacteroidaceae bacterium]